MGLALDETIIPTSLTGGGRSIPHPEDDGDAWDMLVLGNFAMPGIWTVTGDVARDLDKKKSKGKDGQRIKDNGYLNAEIVLIGQMTDRDDWKVMINAMKDIHPRKKGSATEPLACEHPVLAFLGITNVYVQRISSPRIVDGILEIRIAVLEWLPKPKVKKKPKGLPIAQRQRLANQAASGDPLILFRDTPKPSEDTPVYVGGPGFAAAAGL